MAVSEDDTDLRWSCTFSGEFADVVNDGIRGRLEPCWDLSRVWDGGGADTLSFAVKTTHGDGCVLSTGILVDLRDSCGKMVVRKIIGEHMIARLVGAAKLSLRH